MLSKILNGNRGFTAFYIAILLIVIMSGIAISITVLTIGQQKMSGNILRSSQSYFTAESGIEDTLLRLSKNMDWSSPYTLTIGNSTATLDISSIIGGSRTITSQGNFLDRIRKVQAVYTIESDQVAFYYGAQVDEGGLLMGNNAEVRGNVFSNGSILPSGGGTASITGTTKVAINGNKIEKMNIGGDAYVHTCKDSNITGTLHYVSGGSIVNCTYGAIEDMGPNQINSVPLPISSETINKWKSEAAEGGIYNTDFTLTNGAIGSLGPIQIGTAASPKNMTINNNSVLTVKGTIYVTGNINFYNNVTIKLDPSYGSNSGVIIADGKIRVYNNATLRGSGQAGSYLLLLSTNPSLDLASPAMDISNNAQGAIFYTTQGLIHIHNNVQVREVTGYKLALDNNAIVIYESGLENTSFISGPGGAWEVVSWKEIE